MKKTELRQLYLHKRGSLLVGEIASMSVDIAERFFEGIDLSRVNQLHTFIRIRKFNEIDTSIIYYKLWRDFPRVRTIAPQTDLERGEIESVRFEGESELVENKWGIREPVGGEVAESAVIDLVLVPLLCFDESGYRVGYGKGMYDRFLKHCRSDCLKVGLSYFPPVSAIDDVDEHDIRLDMAITPDKTYQFPHLQK